MSGGAAPRADEEANLFPRLRQACSAEMLLRDVHGAFNLAGDPPVDAKVLGELLQAKVVRVPRQLVGAALSTAWGLALATASPRLFDAALLLPLLDASPAPAQRTSPSRKRRSRSTDGARSARSARGGRQATYLRTV